MPKACSTKEMSSRNPVESMMCRSMKEASSGIWFPLPIIRLSRMNCRTCCLMSVVTWRSALACKRLGTRCLAGRRLRESQLLDLARVSLGQLRHDRDVLGHHEGLQVRLAVPDHVPR